MSRVSPLRVALTTGLALGTTAAGLALAPAALAAELAAPTVPATVTPGQPFTVTGAGCVTADDETYPDYEAFVLVTTDLADVDEATEVVVVDPDDSGNWSVQLSFPAGTAGDHEVWAVCFPSYAAEPTQYPAAPLTVGTSSTPVTGTPPTSDPVPPPAPELTPATGQIRGTDDNTPGVTSTDSGTATGDTASPGRTVVKILTGFRPDEVVTVTLHSTPVTVGTFTADASGTVTARFTLPAGTPTGDHTLVFEGDQGTYFQEGITVTAATSASSGDSAGLAYTGADIALPLGLGVAALAVGGGLAFAARRRSAGAAQG